MQEASEPFGRPPIPPPPAEIGDLITRFNGWMTDAGTTTKGFAKVTVNLPMNQLYAMIRAAELRGVMLHFEVYMAHEARDVDLDDLEKQLMEALGGDEDDG